jgi:Uncharacterized protein conserved in archaea
VLAVYDAISVYGTEHMLDLAAGVMDLNLPVVLVVPTTLSYSLRDAAVDVGSGSGTGGGSAGDGGRPDAAADDESAVGDGGAADGDDAPDPADGGIRDAFFIGLGDAVIPTVLVASAAFFLETPSLGIPGLPALTLPALTAMVGTFAGLFTLLWMVLKGRAHAGLPLLNGGAIGGYLLGAVASGVPLLTALGL